jgi:hypothetical protein
MKKILNKIALAYTLQALVANATPVTGPSFDALTKLVQYGEFIGEAAACKVTAETYKEKILPVLLKMVNDKVSRGLLTDDEAREAIQSGIDYGKQAQLGGVGKSTCSEIDAYLESH